MDVLTDMRPQEAAALWSGLLILLMVFLASRVIVFRRANRVLLGDGNNPEMMLRSRVFGNASEYIPLGIGGLVALAALGMPAVPLHVLGGSLFLGRLIHALSLSNKRPTVGRIVGMTLTLLPLLAMGAMLVVHAFVPGPHTAG